MLDEYLPSQLREDWTKILYFLIAVMFVAFLCFALSTEYALLHSRYVLVYSLFWRLKDLPTFFLKIFLLNILSLSIQYSILCINLCAAYRLTWELRFLYVVVFPLVLVPGAVLLVVYWYARNRESVAAQELARMAVLGSLSTLPVLVFEQAVLLILAPYQVLMLSFRDTGLGRAIIIAFLTAGTP